MNYKEIILRYDKNLNDKELTAIRLFNREFTENEIKLEPNNNNILVLLKEIDIKKLKKVTSPLSSHIEKTGPAKNIDISADLFKKSVAAKWSIAPERKMKTYQHPAMFPEELVERILKLFSYKHDIILAPFNGAGTTTLTAKKLQRKYFGIDISDKYCQTARKRIALAA